MRSTFFGLEMARRALGAQRTNVDVIGHNLANAGTEGYRKQDARLTPTAPFDAGGHPRMIMGTGVRVADIARSQNRYLDREVFSRTSDHAMWTKRNGLLREVQDILAEPGDSGIASAMDRFWNAWEDLAGNSDDPAVRAGLLERGSELGDAFRLALRQLDNMSDNLEQTIATRVEKINGIVGELREVNEQAVALEARGLNPNDLLDRRDTLVEELSGLVDVAVRDHSDGGIGLSVDGVPILDSFSGRTLRVADGGGGEPGTIAFEWVTDGGSSAAWTPDSGGELTALVGARNADVPRLRGDIVGLAEGIRAAVNDLHREGFDLAGNPGSDFFADGDPGHLVVDGNLLGNPNLVAAAIEDDSGPSDGRNAARLADLRGEAFVGRVVDGEGEVIEEGVSSGEFWRGVVANVGVRTEQAEFLANNNHVMLTQLKNQRDAVTGVSIDEELTHLIAAQNAFGAAARLVTVWDDMLDTIVNRMVR